MLFLLKTHEIEVFLIYLDRTILLDTSLIFCGIRLYFKFKKQPFRVFRDTCEISSLFVKKLSFSVFFLLNSIEDKDYRFISSEQFHSMVPVSFPFRIQI